MYIVHEKYVVKNQSQLKTTTYSFGKTISHQVATIWLLELTTIGIRTMSFSRYLLLKTILVANADEKVVRLLKYAPPLSLPVFSSSNDVEQRPNVRTGRNA